LLRVSIALHLLVCRASGTMSDDDWLTTRQDPDDQQEQHVSVHARRAAVPAGYGHATVPPPRLLQRPKESDDKAQKSMGDGVAPKTLKQKEAEYAAARARIFGSKTNSTSNGKAQGRARGRGGKGVASVARQSGTGTPTQKVDEASDPDYDRNPELYAPRLSPALIIDGPMPGSGSRYVPPTYENEFPALGR